MLCRMLQSHLQQKCVQILIDLFAQKSNFHCYPRGTGNGICCNKLSRVGGGEDEEVNATDQAEGREDDDSEDREADDREVEQLWVVIYICYFLFSVFSQLIQTNSPMWYFLSVQFNEWTGPAGLARPVNWQGNSSRDRSNDHQTGLVTKNTSLYLYWVCS